MDTLDRGVVCILAIACWSFTLVVYLDVMKINERHAAEDAKAICSTPAQYLYAEEKRLVQWAKANDIVFPDIWAEACMMTSEPQLCMAVLKQESGGRTDLRTGRHGEVGPFQIVPKFWKHLVGYPSQEPKKAALQWDLIMSELQETRSLAAAIGKYNGTGNKGYVISVWTMRQEMM